MKYLIVKTSSLGDVIQTFPVVDYLKEIDPTCQIDWVVEEEYGSLLEAHAGISKVIKIGSRRWRKGILHKKSYQDFARSIKELRASSYDVVFDLQGNTKSAFLTLFARAAQKVGFGWKSSPEWPHYFAVKKRFDVSLDLPIQERYLSIVQQFFKDKNGFTPQGVELKLTEEERKELASYERPGCFKVMVAFASKWENKTLAFPTLIKFLKILSQEENCFFYFASGSLSEYEIAQKLSEIFPNSLVLRKLSFPLWQRLMSLADLVISSDSAALALCGTTSTPSFSFFGPTLASVYKPLGKHHRFFQGECPFEEKFIARCPRLRTCPTGACLKNTNAEALFNAYSQKKALKSQRMAVGSCGKSWSE